MRTLTFIVFALLLASHTSIAQQYEWVKGGGTGDDIAHPYTYEGSYYICTDQNKNVYSLNVIGSHTTMIADTFSHGTTPFGVTNNILLSSYNCNGQMRWAKLITSSNSDVFPFGLAVDNAGHVYLSGNFWHGSLQIGYDSTVASSNQLSATMQFDTNGHLNWLKFIGPNTVANRNASAPGYGVVALDRQQNLHFIKLFKTGSQITPTVLTSYGTYDIVYDQAGNLLSATRLQLDSTLGIKGASIDTSSNKLYVFGEGNSLISPLSLYSGFASAFDLNRNVIWQDTLFAPLLPGALAVFGAIVADGIGHIYYTAVGQGSVAFGGDTVSNAPFSSSLTFAVALKTDTLNHSLWMKGFPTDYPGQSNLGGITLMPNGKIGAAGMMLGNINIGYDSLVAYSGEGYNNYFTIMDTAGYVHELKQLHSGGNNDGAHCVASDKFGNLYIGGSAAPTVWGGTITPYTAVGGNTDFFVMKYGMDCNCTGMPVATFTHSGNPNVTFTYTGTVAGIDSVRWWFGDGSTATTFSTAHTFTAAGTYTVRCNIYSACGNDSRFATIVVLCVAPPVANFTSTGITAARNFTYTGTAVSLDSVVWNFGDGGHAVGLTATHTYAATGTFNACVTAYNHCGSHTFCNPVVITCVNHLTANYTHTSFAPMSFTYTGTTTGMDSVVWHYGDGGHSTGTTSTHNYPAIGTYTACVLAYNHCGVDSICSTFTLPCVTAPVAAFTTTGTGTTRNFTYTGTSVALDSVVWNFGDGGHAVGLTTSHTYTSAGIFSACVTVYSPCGSNTTCTLVNISCVIAPVAAFTATGTPMVTFNYTGTMTGLDSVVWNFGDGGHGSGPALTHLYAIADTYTVCVTAYNHCGWDSVCSDVIVTCPVPVALFSYSGSPAITFIYTGSTLAIDSVVWDFNDGTSDTGIAPVHSYSGSGTYHVCMIVYTLCGSDTVCLNIPATGLGIPSLPLTNIQVYPNPATDEVNIAGIPAITNYRLLNITGVTLQQGVLQKGSNAVLMKNYAPGIYIMELSGMDGSKNIVRVVKQ